MSLSPTITAALFALLAVAHSVAGETGFIRPLVNAEWTIAEVPRWAANRLLRTAWHLTSVAWMAMAVVAIGGTPLAAISVSAMASSGMMFFGLRGHPAWPLFLLAGLFGFYSEGWLSDPVLGVGVGVAVIGLVTAAGLHLYWVAGGQFLADVAVPQSTDGKADFSPGPLLTAAVALLLLGFASLVFFTAVTDEPWFVRWLVFGGVAVLAIRAIGDGKTAGFTKKHRDNRFEVYDDRYFTPLVVFLAIGSAAATLI